MENKNLMFFGIGLIALIVIVTIGIIVRSRMKTTNQNSSDGNVLYSPETTRTYSPDENIILDYVQLVTLEDKVAANTSADEISGFIMAAEQKVKQVFATNQSEFKLLIRFTMYPSDHHKVEIASQGNVDSTLLQKLTDELGMLESIHSKTDSIVFQAAFTIKVNK